MTNGGEYNNLFTSLISDVKSYNGTDPLLPWLRGIRKMEETLPSHLLQQKLPRFLQRCSETFIANRRYSNDLRYLRVWLQLMDFVDDPKSVLRTMEKNRIGMKKPLFYQAYALYYEKMKKFDAAEKMYHLGVQNLAEPADELQKSYAQFLHRLERHKNKRLQGRKTNSRRLTQDELRDCKENSDKTDDLYVDDTIVKDPHSRRLLHEDTLVSRFVGSMISDEPEVENVLHHGLVDPTINLKQAMEDINNMFGKPIEFARKSRPRKHDVKSNCGEFLILPDDEPDDGKADTMSKHSGFLILPDGELDNQQDSSLPTGKGSDLFEQTLCTKEAMDEINKLFAMPMDF